MALRRRNSGGIEGAVWPGFVDSMTSLLLVLMFVLTIFTVVQFVLSDTISGQKDELSDLTAQVASLTDALGLSEGRVASLGADLSAATDREAQQSALIVALTQERDSTRQSLAEAETRITGFEAQVAGLLAERADLQTQVADLTDDQTRLMTEAEALNLALATARSEIDAQVEAARLAAAEADAMEALIASLQDDVTENTDALAAADAQRLLDQAAAEALRARLNDSDAELTAMTLALEEQRRRAEEALTLLAAAEAARTDLDVRLAAALAAAASADAARGADTRARQTVLTDLTAALAAQQAAEGQVASLSEEIATATADLAATEEERAALEQQLAAAILARDTALDAARLERDDLEQQLAAAVLARESAEAQLAAAGNASTEVATLQEQIQGLLAQLANAQGDSARALSASEAQQALLAAANARLAEEEALSADSLRQVAALSQQVAELRSQVSGLQQLLDLADAADVDAEIRIESLSQQLNTALARAAAEERRARLLEEEEASRLRLEAERLAAEAQDLERYRSEFFGRLREVLDGQEGIRVVGDRFVFSSEVLFAPGSATLSPEGEGEIARAAGLLRQIADEIPAGIDWVIQVDGHTDNVPLSGTGEFRDNWELSQARALSVVRFMTRAEGIPPERLSANGFGEFQPLVPLESPEARALNRRIELKLTER